MRQIMVRMGLLCGMLWAAQVTAGGNPEYVPFPKGYGDSFVNYVTMNRAGDKALVGKLWANDIAMASYRAGDRGAPGSIVVMEVYKPRMDAAGKPIVGGDGVYELGKLAAVAVMQRAERWDAAFPAEDRLAGWGFAMYQPDGSPKDNQANCVECHTPLAAQDYLFTFAPMKAYAGRR